MLSLFRKSKPETDAARTGKWGEYVAAKALKKNGYKIIGRRVRIGQRDEFDIVARKLNTLVFVEVKTRRDERFGRPASAVGQRQRHALSRAAVRYIQRLRSRPDYFRFDIVEVVGRMGEAEPIVRHIENAFPLDSQYNLRW